MAGLPARLVHIISAIALLFSLLAGCGGPPAPAEQFPLESVNREAGAVSHVYRAAGRTVPQAAAELAQERQPDEISAADDADMFLVYGDQLVHVQQDPAQPSDALIEVNNAEYVRRNYDSSFLQGYLTASLLGRMFGTFGGGGYRGYASRHDYRPAKGAYRPPTRKEVQSAPLTVSRRGGIVRRGPGAGTGGNTGYGGRQGSVDRGAGRPGGGIYRGGPGRGYRTPGTRIEAPRTRYGTGRIGRRGRR